MTDRPPLRYRLWVNDHSVRDAPATATEAARWTEIAVGLLKPQDTFVAVAVGRDWEPGMPPPLNPWVRSDSVEASDRILREHYPGLKVQMGEARWQLRNGERYAPAPADAWDGVG